MWENGLCKGWSLQVSGSADSQSTVLNGGSLQVSGSADSQSTVLNESKWGISASQRISGLAGHSSKWGIAEHSLLRMSDWTELGAWQMLESTLQPPWVNECAFGDIWVNDNARSWSQWHFWSDNWLTLSLLPVWREKAWHRLSLRHLTMNSGLEEAIGHWHDKLTCFHHFAAPVSPLAQWWISFDSSRTPK